MGEATRIVGFVALTLWCHGPLSPFLPAAYEPILLAYGRLFPPLLLAVIGAVASTGVEYLNYHLYRRMLKCDAMDRVFRSPSGRWLVGLFCHRPFFAVWLCVCSPLPDWSARILASRSGYSVRRYLAAFLLARLPRFWVLAALGLHLHVGIGPLLAIAGGSVIIALAMRWRGSLASQASKHSPTRGYHESPGSPAARFDTGRAAATPRPPGAAVAGRLGQRFV